MRTTGSTMSRFDKRRAVKSSGMPRSRRDNAVRGNPAAHQKIHRTSKVRFFFGFQYLHRFEKGVSNSKKAYLKNTNFYQSSNNQDFQGFAPFEPTEAVLVSNTNKLMI